MNDVIAQLQQQVHANASGGFEQVIAPSKQEKNYIKDIFWQLLYETSVTHVSYGTLIVFCDFNFYILYRLQLLGKVLEML